MIKCNLWKSSKFLNCRRNSLDCRGNPFRDRLNSTQFAEITEVAYLGFINDELNHMKTLLLLVILTVSMTSTSQVWVEQNANWHYDYWNIGYAGFYEMEYVQDTMVGGVLCQQLETTSYQFGYNQTMTLNLINTFSFPTQFTYVSGDTVFYWNENQFFTYLNFGSNIGDQ